MIINYDSNPSNSIYYTAACIYKYIIEKSSNYDDVYNYFIRNINKHQTMFFLSLDYLYLINKINKIEEGRIL